ncbi:MAG: hypothetical protein HKN85_08625, partial [Gammaproteobacteria bacterium]|nr:hypothetical protein [Gammaproteobacteria bacterium]
MDEEHHIPLPVRHPTASRTYKKLRWELWLVFMLVIIGLLYLRYGNELFELRIETIDEAASAHLFLTPKKTSLAADFPVARSIGTPHYSG